MSSRAELLPRLKKLPQQIRTLIGNGLVFPLSGLFPRRDDLWLFGHQDGAFAGNSKLLFLWVLANRPDLRPAWISSDRSVVEMLRSHGCPAYRKGSPAAMLLSLRAGVFVYCHGAGDVGLALSRGALHVNLWHGVGLKALAHGNPDSQARIYGRRGWIIRTLQRELRYKPDLLVTTSDLMQRHFATQFRLTEEQCPPLGYPRLDAALDDRLAERARQFPGSDPAVLWPKGIDEVYAYLPTYRDKRGDFARAAIPDVGRLDRVLEKRNAILYLKPHRHTAGDWPVSARVRPWPEGVNLDSSLPKLTGAITDYSSVHYDYLFHSDRGSILYLFDEEDYLSTDRLLLQPLRENIAGRIAASFEELLEILESGAALEPCAEAAPLRRKFWGNGSGPASPRIVAFVEATLKRRRQAGRRARKSTPSNIPGTAQGLD